MIETTHAYDGKIEINNDQTNTNKNQSTRIRLEYMVYDFSNFLYAFLKPTEKSESLKTL